MVFYKHSAHVNFSLLGQWCLEYVRPSHHSGLLGAGKSLVLQGSKNQWFREAVNKLKGAAVPIYCGVPVATCPSVHLIWEVKAPQLPPAGPVPPQTASDSPLVSNCRAR